MTAGNASAGFDVEEYTRTPYDLRPDSFDLAAIPSPTAAELRTLDYLWRCEHGILDLMRDVLVTPTHAESRVTAFLVTWGYEQYWLAESLHAVLTARHDAPPDDVDTPVGRVRRVWDERVLTMATSLRTNLLGESIVAGHMLTGWLDTAALMLCYQRLAERNPHWQTMAGAVVAMKQRHLDFYADQLQERATHPGAVDHIRGALRRWRWPGTRYSGHRAIHPVVEYLLADPACEREVNHLDATVSSLATVGRITPLRRALGRFVH